MNRAKSAKALGSAFLVFCFFEIVRWFALPHDLKSGDSNNFWPGLLLIVIAGLVIFAITRDRKE